MCYVSLGVRWLAQNGMPEHLALHTMLYMETVLITHMVLSSTSSDSMLKAMTTVGNLCC